MRRALVRGTLAGLAFAVCHYAVEVAGTFAVLHWTGIGEILRALTSELALLLLEYGLFGAVVGGVLAVPVSLLERRLPVRLRGGWLYLLAMALAFVAFTFFWNDDSVLLRSIYVLMAAATLAILGFLALLRWSWRRFVGPRLPVRVRPFAFGAGAVAVLAVLGVGGLSLGRPAPRRAAVRPAITPAGPNVVLLVVDTLRADHLGAYGYGRPTSPAIDRIAAEGVVFERAFSPAPWTLPAHASLFTGLHSSRHRTYYGRERLGADKRTIAEVLAEAGYRTGGFSANPWVGEPTGLDQGFDTFEYTGSGVITDTLFLELAKRKSARADLGGARTAQRLVRWVGAARERGERFFAFANFMEVHEPYGSVPGPYFSSFLDRPLRRGVGRLWLRETPLYLCNSCNPADHPDVVGLRCEGGRWRIEDWRLRDTLALYDAGIRYVDHQVGAIYDALGRAGVLDDTLLIVTSDHGEFLGEHGRIGHGVHLYDPLLHVPLIVRYPRRFPAGSRVRHDVSLLDVFPTLAALVGSASPPDPEAAVLDPADTAAQAPRPIRAEDYPFDAVTLEKLARRQKCDYTPVGFLRASLQVGRLKYIWSSGGQPELYDLLADPQERENLAPSEPARRAELDARLQAWRSAAKAAAAAADSPMDPLTRQRLESLGYTR